MFIILPTPEGALQNGYHATLGMALSADAQKYKISIILQENHHVFSVTLQTKFNFRAKTKK